MEEKFEEAPKRPKPNFLSKLLFSYMIPIFYKGRKHEFLEEDLYEISSEYDSQILGDRLEKEWEIQKTKKNPSLFKAYWAVFKYGMFGPFLLNLINDLFLKILPSFCLSKLLLFYSVNQTKISENEPVLYATVIILSIFINILLGHRAMLLEELLGMQMRIAGCSLIYRKSLKLSQGSLATISIGQIVNLSSNDVARFDMVMKYLFTTIVGVIKLLVIACLLYFTVGAYSLLGLILIIFNLVLSVFLGQLSKKYRAKIARKTDERVGIMNEVISAIQVIKMYTWEKPFVELVKAARRMEISHIQKTTNIRGIIYSTSMYIHKCSVFIGIVSYIFLGNQIDAYHVFVMTAYYNILRITISSRFPVAVSSLLEAYVSLKRMETFLGYEEVQPKQKLFKNVDSNTQNKVMFSLDANKLRYIDNIINEIVPTFEDRETKILIRDCSAKWLSSSNQQNLININFTAKPSNLIIVFGSVGSGKSTLLNLILKEIVITAGKVQVSGTTSYASQIPWIFSASIRQNILFGQKMMRQKYEKVLKICQLEKDLQNFPHGDRTIVGERGVMLSGGQKSRISLARAVYKDADIYLLDDPLSAVDTIVGKKIFEGCILDYLKNKCVVLVTHQIKYLKSADNIFKFEDGKIIKSGTYSDFNTEKLNNDEEKYIDTEDEVKHSVISLKQKEVKEHCCKGTIHFNVYKKYLESAGGNLVGLILLFLIVATQGIASGIDYFTGYWTNLEQRKINESLNAYESFIEHNSLYIYTTLMILLIFSSLLRSIIVSRMCLIASKNLHNNMFKSLVKATMRFFDTNPSGRILNRFSKDTGAADELLPTLVTNTFEIIFEVIAAGIVISIINPYSTLCIAVILVICYCIKDLYLKIASSFKRLEGTTKSPVFTHMAASIQGISTIRASNIEKIIIKEFDQYQNRNTSANYIFLLSNRAFGFYIDINCLIYTAIVTLVSVLGDSEKLGGNVGLVITQALAITCYFQYGMRQWTELGNQMTSIERIVEYTDLPQEPDSEENAPPNDWPKNGKIVFRNLSLKYSTVDPFVLNNLSFTIKPKEKIGIVGRTGAGKSSLIAALFRLALNEGEIFIDDINIHKISLESLRSKISIIPQDPLLFSGTIRKNLDPFKRYSDDILWNALEDVELKSVVQDLDHGVSEDGSNFSVGQRQLICLARAIIRKNKILILDEATANIDMNTDSLIQKTIREKFKDCTVLTIAHRLHTIMDSDQILVMDSGKLVEFDKPSNLLYDESSVFYDLVRQCGKSHAEKLVNSASEVTHL